jgi:histidine triad (HIT) family protein
MTEGLSHRSRPAGLGEGAPVPGCAFCAIVDGRSEALLVLEDEAAVAFLDHRPLFPGHCLLVPRAHHETLFDLPPSLVAPFFLAARLLARAVQEAMAAEGTFLALNNRVSQSVPHLHVHVVPRRFKDGLRGFFWPRQKYESTEAMRRVQAAVSGSVQALRAGAHSPSRDNTGQ